ncbi:MAG: NAD-dependent epimerase/dehydratase family protein [Aminipila sp.]
MKILITGANGFIGKNLTCELKNRGYNDLCFCNRDTNEYELEDYVKNCDVVVHLAGVNRPINEEEFKVGNADFTEKILQLLKKNNSKAMLIMTSSTQATLDNPYGKSKLEAERLLRQYHEDTTAPTITLRLTNVFGKWCKPNYNSVVATFCNNIANDMPIQIHNKEKMLNLIYIDDVVNGLIEIINIYVENKETKNIEKFISKRQELLISSDTEYNDIYFIKEQYSISVGNLAEALYDFKESRKNLNVSDMSNDFIKKLYSTYLSYLPVDSFSYPLKMNVDERGSFTEILKADSFGQVSVNISKPGITKGNHWHHTKNEKFLVVSGHGVIRFRKILTNEDGTQENIEDNPKVIEYYVSSDKMEVVDIPPGYTHNIENLGNTDLVTIMWVNESFNEEKPDTFFLKI